jgi:hypothetical protein
MATKKLEALRDDLLRFHPSRGPEIQAVFALLSEHGVNDAQLAITSRYIRRHGGPRREDEAQSEVPTWKVCFDRLVEEHRAAGLLR